MSTITTPIVTPTTPDVAPLSEPWPDVYTDPNKVCPQQKREGISPDIAP
jgi:hypothetical protein